MAGTFGEVVVDGSGSTLNAHMFGNLQVGVGGDGTLGITGGGLATGAVGNVGTRAGSTGDVLIEGTGSTWMNRVTLSVGHEGQGTVRVASGGQLSSGQGIIGYAAGSVGEVSVTGAGSVWSGGSIQVAVDGTGTLIITNGGSVATTTTLAVGSLGEIKGDGNIVGTLENGGLVSPGLSPGALNVDGGYTQNAAGELLIELASASSFDQLLVTGKATLDGVLTVNLLDGFVPSIGQSFTILTADDVDGTFSTEMLPTVPNVAFGVIYNAQSVVVTVSAIGVPGDFNADGIVDAADYVVWRKTGGSQADYSNWRADFGATAAGAAAVAASADTGSASANAAIPEPATLWLALAWIAILAQRRHTHWCAH